MLDNATAPNITITYGAASYDVRVVPADRQTIGVKVEPDLSITARVPADIETDELHGLVEAKGKWIAKQVRDFAQLHPLPMQKFYVAGETHTYLGRRYRLKTEKSPDVFVKLQGKYFVVAVPDKKDTAAVERALSAWYSEHARKTFHRRIDVLRQVVDRESIPHPKEVVIRKMETRWGSCSARGRITLNTELVKTPVDCIDYVIAHELCHLVVPDHSRKYWALLSKVMPDWKRRRSKLSNWHAHG